MHSRQVTQRTSDASLNSDGGAIIQIDIQGTPRVAKQYPFSNEMHKLFKEFPKIKIFLV